ncbi:MAG: gliding motility-associated C-terminal domain-containing protein [Bacteroidia bacterium]
MYGSAQALPFTWVRSAGTGSEQDANAVAADLSGNVYVTGFIKGNNNNFSSVLISSTGGEDIFLAKYDQNGNILWAKPAGGSGNDRGLSIAVDNSGNVYVCGFIEGTATFFGSPNITVSGSGNFDIFVAKYNSSGSVLWVKRAGSSNDGSALGVCTNGTDVFITGEFAGTVAFGSLPFLTSSGGTDAFIASYNAATGTENWAIKGGSSSNDVGSGITADASGVYVSGFYDGTLTFQNMPGTLTNSGASDVFVVKYNLAGTGIWKRKAGGTGDDNGNSISVSGSLLYVAGDFSGTMSLFDTGPAVATITSASGIDAFIIQYDATSGNYAWVKSESGTSTDKALSVSANPAGDVFLTGYFSGTLPFGSGPSVSANADDIFVTKYNAAGTFLWGKKVIGSADDYGRGIVAPDNTSAYIAGTYKSSPATFDAQSISTSSNFDIYVAKLGCTCTVSNAGADQTFCASSTVTLAGNTPITGTGVWTRISGTGTITSPSSPTSGVTGLSAGSSVFQWTITNSVCPASTNDQITILIDANPTTANAGADQNVCSSTATLAGNAPVAGTGMWTLVSGTGTITTPTSPTSGLTGLSGTSVFQWTISNGTCPSSSDNVTLIRDPNPTAANAGPDQTICSSNATLAGNAPSIGTGLWSLVSGTGVIATPASANSSLSGLSTGANVFRWTTSNGSCPSTNDLVTINVDANPTLADAGPDQTICSSSSTFGGNVPSTGNGFWSLISGTGSVATPSSATSTVTGLSVGANVFRWTITNGTCPASFDNITINRDANPTVANAGVDQTLCNSTTTLAGNSPATGTGLWTLISGTGSATSPTSNTSGVTGLTTGANVFQWTISNGTCPASSDQVTINHDANPTVANAGTDQTVCSSSATLAGNIPSTGTGFWTLISGTGIITIPSSASSTVNGLSVGANIFRWTISNGTCASTLDEVTVFRDATPTASNAGADQNICSASVSLAGNSPATGTGNWTLISGTGTIVTPGSATSTVNGLSVGANVFRWTITNGVCASSFDDVTITRDPNPTTANAGSDQTICSSSTALAGNTLTIGTGNWTLISGTGVLVNSTSPSSAVNGLSAGANVFRWTTSNGTCPSTFDEVTINRDLNPTTANAGADQTICSAATSLAGNAPVIGTGLWTLISGTGTIVTPSSPTSTVNGLSVGANIFRWTITNGTCAASFDEVTINLDANPTTANAGIDQTICSSSTSLTGNTPVIGNGLWTLISGTGTIVTPTSPTSSVSAMTPGANVFRWTITNGTCTASFDEITIIVDPIPSTAAAGPDQTICSSSTAFAGNVPSIGSGAWSLISGTGIITTSTSEISTVTGLSVGANIFQWTISNGTCPASSDQVTINVDANPTTANAGIDQTICSSSTSLTGNTPVIGTGVWTLISGTGTIVTPNSPSSVVNGLSAGATIFKWEISNGTCSASLDTVLIYRDPVPTAAAAGSDQTICSSSATLTGNVPLTGSGNWTLISGSGIITSSGSPVTTVTGLSVGANIFKWEISNGTCPSSIDMVTINVDAYPTTANAGSDQALCNSSSSFTGNIPLTGTATWSVISGPGIIANASQPSSVVTNLATGLNVFAWTISNGVCPLSQDTVSILIDQFPTLANAGPDQQLCSSVSAMNGNIPAVGTGTWLIVNSTGNFTTAGVPNTAVTNLSLGSNTFEWVITNGTCPASHDTVMISVDNFPTVANAGSDQLICSGSSVLQGNIPSIGTGSWIVLAGTGLPGNPSSAITAVTNLSPGQNTFEWRMSNGVCPVSVDTVIIAVDSMPSNANAGIAQTICSSTSVLNAAVPSTGAGQWYVISGGSSLINSSLASTAVNALSNGLNVFEWVVSNGVCPSSHDTITISVDENPGISNAGIDAQICDPFDTLTGNIPLIGSGIWYTISSAAVINTPLAPTTGVSNLSAGWNKFEWVITNGTCPASRDTVGVFYTQRPSAPDGGPDISVCAHDAFMQGELPVTGTGYWNNLSNTGSFADPADPFSALNNIPDGSYLYTWTTSNAYCISNPDTVVVNVYSTPTLANAGADQLVHTTFATLNAIACDTGFGTWSFVSGSGAIENINDPATKVLNLAGGINILRWTTSNGVCLQTDDDVQIESRPLIIPTGYSPNADGTNDNFVIEGLLEYSNTSLEVFNRWGNQVFITSDYKNDWNGAGGNGQVLPDDIYYYILKLDDGTVFTGYVSLKQKTL